MRQQQQKQLQQMQQMQQQMQQRAAAVAAAQVAPYTRNPKPRTLPFLALPGSVGCNKSAAEVAAERAGESWVEPGQASE